MAFGLNPNDTTLQRTLAEHRNFGPYGVDRTTGQIDTTKGYDPGLYGRRTARTKRVLVPPNRFLTTYRDPEPERFFIRGGDTWQGARDALTYTGPLGHSEQADNQLQLPRLRTKHLYEPVRRAGIEQGVLRPVNRWKKKMRVHDRMGELAAACRRDLMCLQRYKGDYPYPNPPPLAPLNALLK